MSRAGALRQRGLVSLRTRGWRATGRRVAARMKRAPARTLPALRFPTQDAFAPFSVPTSAVPRASVIVPVFNQFTHTLTCLRTLAQMPPTTPFEVIVVDDGSSDETVEALPQIEGIRFHRRGANGGFVAACNDGAALAEGEHLVFLNNDTIPQPGWLEALVRTLDEVPGAGLVGAQLLYQDGRLQEAGGVVFSDGSCWSYGRFGSPDDPRYSYVRDCDYVTGAAIAVRRELFEAVGGFDPRYSPAYYEDTDLAFAVRASGARVIYQPAARVVHTEGGTAGTNPDLGVKAYQVRNRQVFADKWAQELGAYPARQDDPGSEVVHRGSPQVLVIDERTPTPDQDSGSVRLVNVMRLLKEEGAHVVFFPTNLAHARTDTESLQQLGVEAWYSPYAGRTGDWLRTNGGRFTTVMVSRHYVARPLLPLLRRAAPQAQLVFDSVDLHYIRESRAAEVAHDQTLAAAALRTRASELAVIADTDLTLVVSDAEREVLAKDAPGARVELLSNIHEISGEGLPFAERRDLVFVGGFRHTPNVDSVRWFVEEVLPLVRHQLTEVQFHCIGADPPAAIVALADRPGVRLHGHVPDIDIYMDGCRIGLAPLRYGAGVKGKVNLSMAHGQPVVATSAAVEGMHLRDGQDVLVGDSPQAYAAAVVRLYTDESLWRTLSLHGLDNIREHFSMDAARGVALRLLAPSQAP